LKKSSISILIALCLVLASCARDTSIKTPTQSSLLQVTTQPSPTQGSNPAPPAAATPSLIAPTQTPASIQDIAGKLKGLAIDAFFDESYRQLMLRDPEGITAAGVSARIGIGDDRLNDLSDAYTRQTQQLVRAVLDLLPGYDRKTLTPGQQVSYDVYRWYLEDLVKGQQFMYDNYPIHHFVDNYQDKLVRLFTDYQPMTSHKDAEGYISRLGQVKVQVSQLLEGLRLRQQAGVVLPDFILQQTLFNINDYLGSTSPDPALLSVYTTFTKKIASVSGLSKVDQDALAAQALFQVKESFIPGMVDLVNFLEGQLKIASSDAGVWKFPDGEAYYAYILHQQTGANLTPAQVHQLGLTEVARIQAEMKVAFQQLGYPSTLSFSQSVRRAMDEGGYFNTTGKTGQDSAINQANAALKKIDPLLGTQFSRLPLAHLEIRPDPVGGFYTPGSADGSRPGVYYFSVGRPYTPKYTIPTIAYHEGIPGHHLQIAMAQELNLPFFRTQLIFNGYSEGWALYAEQLAFEMGMYKDDPLGNIGRLQYELLRAVRLVADTGIHALRWTRQLAIDYVDETTGMKGIYSYEVDRYVVWPGQAAGYKIGMIKILELRQLAQKQLGISYDQKEFHNLLLTNGSMPLDVLDTVVNDFIAQKITSRSK
jgi:uncharacterized protein (DUF885 family)